MLTTSFLGAAEDILRHDLVPFRSRPVYLRLVTTLRRAKDYAAGGFHVAVSRGLPGGCRDSSMDFAKSGTTAAVCASPMNDTTLRNLWADAAQGYRNVYFGPTSDLEAMRSALAAANASADLAFKAEGVEPPRDPVTLAVEPANPGASMTAKLAFAALGLFAASAVTYGVRRRQQAYYGHGM